MPTTAKRSTRHPQQTPQQTETDDDVLRRALAGAAGLMLYGVNGATDEQLTEMMRDRFRQSRNLSGGGRDYAVSQDPAIWFDKASSVGTPDLFGDDLVTSVRLLFGIGQPTELVQHPSVNGKIRHTREPKSLPKTSTVSAASEKKALPKTTTALPATSSARMEVIGEEEIPINKIVPSDENPRSDFDRAFLQQLGDSMAEHGQLSPIVVRTPRFGKYELVDGETRWRAAQLKGLATLRATIVECTDAEAALARVLSYRQRRDLNPIEEARGIKLLLEKYGCTQRELETKVGISQGQISNRLRLLELPKAWQQRVIAGELSATAARSLAAWSDVPELFAKAEKDWKNQDYARDELCRDTEDWIERSLRKVSQELAGVDYDNYTNGGYLKWRIDTGRLTPDQIDELRIRDVPAGNGSTEPRAFNTKRALQLRDEAIKSARAKLAAKGEKKEKAAKSEKLTPAEQKKRAADLQAQYEKKLARWLTRWYQDRIVEALPEFDDALLLALTMHFACSDGQHGRHEDLDEVAGKKSKHPLPSAVVAWTGMPKDRRTKAWIELLQLWVAGETEGYRAAMQASDVAHVAFLGDIDIVKDWKLEESFLELHTTSQLQGLGKEWKLDPPAGKRSELVAWLLDAAAKKPCPAILKSLDVAEVLR